MRDKRGRLPLPGGRTRFRSTHQAREFCAATLSERSSTDVTHDQPDRTAGPGRDRTRAAPDAERDRPRLGSGAGCLPAVAGNRPPQRGRREPDRLAQPRGLGQDRRGRRRVRPEGRSALRLGSARLRQLGGPGRPAPPDDRGPRERGRLPRQPQWQWQQRTPVRRRPTLLTPLNHSTAPRRPLDGAAWGRSPTHEESGPASFSPSERNPR